MPEPVRLTRPRAADGVARLPPGYFALVMATGIVANASAARGLSSVSLVLGWLDVALYIALAALHGVRLARFPTRAWADFVSHARGPGYFTWVAATAVLGSQFLVVHDDVALAFVLWAMAVVLWLAITYGLFTVFAIKRRKPTLAYGINGSWLLAVVATQSLAVLAAQLAPINAEPYRLGLNFVALSLWLWGGMLYIWLILLIFYRIIFFRLAPGDVSPPFWISMGAMAISTLAGGLLIDHAAAAPYLQSLRPFLEGLTVFYWATGTWWVPVLVVFFVWRYRRGMPVWRYRPANWGAVFPLGMYAAATFKISTAMPLAFLADLADVFLAAALLAWAVNFVGMGRQVWVAARRIGQSDSRAGATD